MVDGKAAIVGVEPWQAWWGATQRCTDVVALEPAHRVDFEITHALPGGATMLYACDQRALVVDGRAAVWVPPVGRPWGPDCVAWADRWDGATSEGGDRFDPAETPLVVLERVAMADPNFP